MRTLIAVLITVVMGFLPLIAQDDAQEEESTPLKVSYARNMLELDSRIVFSRTAFVKGVQSIPISDELLAGFKPDYVEFFLDGELVHLDREAPWQADIDTGSSTARRSFMVIASREVVRKIEPQQAVNADGSISADSSGTASGSGTIEQLAETFEVVITTPAEGNYVIGRSPVVVDAYFEDSGVLESVQIYIDNQLVATLTEAPWEHIHNFGRSFNGRTIRVVAFDNYGRKAETSRTTPPLEQSTFYVQSRVVTLDVTAFDEAGRLVGGLQQEDFTVYDNGEPVDIRFFSTEERPIWVAILVDTSGSMRGAKIRRSLFAAQQFISQLKEVDHASFYTFGPEVTLVSEFTNNFPRLIDEISRLNAIRNAMTPINDGIYTAMETFADKAGRKAIIVISDGADTASVSTPDMVHEMAKRMGIRIYSIGIEGLGGSGGMSNNPADWLLRGLADVTGGAAYFPFGNSEFLSIFTTITTELRSTYTIGYTPPENTGNDWRTVRVEIEGGGKARTKEGYYPDEY